MPKPTFWMRVATINEQIGLRLTLLVGTMWVTYLFFIYGFIPLVEPSWRSSLLYWSNTLQLWLLPAILVGQNVIGRIAEKQAARQYEMIARINALTAQMHTVLEAVDHIVGTLLTMAEANRDDIANLAANTMANREALATIAAKTNEIDAEVDAITAHQGLS